jgi:hypothetical protein
MTRPTPSVMVMLKKLIPSPPRIMHRIHDL